MFTSARSLTPAKVPGAAMGQMIARGLSMEDIALLTPHTFEQRSAMAYKHRARITLVRA
jgi:hypothetical protein